jgi:hypothetical protein
MFEAHTTASRQSYNWPSAPLAVETLRPVDRQEKLSRYIVLLAIAWMVIMTWQIYPQFKDAVRVDGRVTTVVDYIDDACGQRVGPAAETCLAEARATAQRLLRREQGKSILLIEAPLLLYLLIYAPLTLWRNRRRAGALG